MSKRSTPDKGKRDSVSDTPVLDAVRAQLAALYQEMIEDRSRLERQRRRVDKLLFDHMRATEPRAMLSAMEQAYSLKEIWRDHLIEVSGEVDTGPRLHSYDLDQRGQRFGVSGDALRQAVVQCGPDLACVMEALALMQDAEIKPALAVDDVAVPTGRTKRAKGSAPLQRLKEKIDG
jgi:hypothetical protein